MSSKRAIKDMNASKKGDPIAEATRKVEEMYSGKKKKNSIGEGKERESIEYYEKVQNDLNTLSKLGEQKGEKYYEEIAKGMGKIGERAENAIKFNPEKKEEILDQMYGILSDMEGKNKVRNILFPRLLKTYGYLTEASGYSIKNQKYEDLKEYWKTKGDVKSGVKMKDLKLHGK